MYQNNKEDYYFDTPLAFKLEGKLLYATQFHPELNYYDNVVRLKHYYNNYHHQKDDE